MWPFKKRRADGADSVEISEFLHDEGAENLHAALEKRDWETAREILSAADREHFMYYVEVASDVKGLEEWITEPIRAEPGSTLPLLLRGARAVSWAWEARGSGTADTVGQDAWKVWFQRLKLAENCLDEVVDRDPGNAEAWHYLITLARARQLPIDEHWRRFNKLIEIDPSHLFGHEQMLNNLMPKWSGSNEAMFDFARTRAAACPGTHVPVLIAKAHIEYHWKNGREEYLERDEVADEINAAAYESVWHDDYETSLLTPVLWNDFAYTLTYGRYFKQAWHLYESIEDDWVRQWPWGGVKWFLKAREHARENQDY
ncbi:hypothetical protein [Actinoplanes sp. NPDC049118]|uniref:hypothetical protein n=1 Tax=Actinoplanes sp. NPDC049118 TaxID=3155769 RepID=UPI0033C4854A